ncbi:hypothetical protein KUTeg_016124 [Tegillarca granosa]|uniref:Protein sidekick n=1 Tax=Tegillarca granosa TaxID=220873 RepID=A0ABQ9EL20_TEGGR|nr:hypothetical protein KUTeg_016124 [Tegillarca granosa]
MKTIETAFYDLANILATFFIIFISDAGNPPQFFSMEPQCGSAVREGDVKILQCQAYSIPAASYSWMKDGQMLQNEKQSTLIMSNIDRSKAGAYRCIANNSHGAILSKSCDVVVAYSGSVIIPPTVEVAPVNTTVKAGSYVVKFECVVNARPLTGLRTEWYRINGNQRQIIVGNQEKYMFPTRYKRQLLIRSPVSSDSGVYECEVVLSTADGQQRSVSASAHLDVISKPPEIIRKPSNFTIIENNDARLACEVEGAPKPDVMWTRDTGNGVEVITSGGRIQVLDAELLVASTVADDSGVYTCNATNNRGTVSAQAYLLVLELPHAPRISIVTLYAEDFRSVNVSWSPGFDGHSAIERFIMQYRLVAGLMLPEEGWNTMQNPILPNSRWHIVDRLRPARNYQFRVSAVNAVGEGPYSSPHPALPGITMPEQAPSSPPRGFYGQPHTNTSILLHWQPPEESTWNGNLTGYVIRFKLAGYSDITYQTRNTTNWAETSYILSNLIIYQEYDIQIAAYNSKGVGDFTPPYRVRTKEGRPTRPPRNVEVLPVNSTCINITWLPPDGNYFNGVVRGYSIHLKHDGVGQPKIVIVEPDPDDPNGLQVKYLCDLLKYANYTVSVLCFTNEGDGPSSTEQIVRTNEDVPGEVGNLRFTNIRDTSLKVSWTVPELVNGILIEYTIMWEKKNLTTTRKKVELKPSFTYYTIQQLSPSTKYTIYVYARTGVGPGPTKSADIESGVPPELPKPPTNLGYSNVKARSVYIQFYPGFDGNTSITEWIVEGQVGDSLEWKEIYRLSKPTARDFTVHNLKPYTQYALRIIAVNIVGPSNPSLPSERFQTLQAPPNVPPDNVTVRAVNSTALRVSWTPLAKENWNGNPRGYKIFHKLKDDMTFTEVVLDMDKDSFILNSLQEWMIYEVKMKAFNDVEPTAGPSNVAGLAVSSTSINVTWGDVPALEQNGEILGYKVRYESLDENIPPEIQDVPGNITKSVLIIGLRKYVQYQVQVLAYTRMGDGILSQPKINVTTHEDVPGLPVMIWFPEVSFSTAKVVWSPPLEPNGILTGYMVSYKMRDGTDITNSSVLNPARREFTVASLKDQVYYIFMVKASTRLGWGDTASVLVYTSTTRSIPQSPSKPNITSDIQPRSITISWQSGFDGYGPLRNYTVEFKSHNGAWTETEDTVPPTSTSYTVTGLRPNTKYSFRVAATNDEGRSEFSPPSDEVKTREDEPEGAPVNVIAVPLTTNSIQVTWDQPPVSTWNGDLLGYIVQHRKVDMVSFAEKPIRFPNQATILDNLTKFVNYEIRIIAYNSAGNSPHSTPTIIYVGEAAPAAPPKNLKINATSSTELYLSWEPPPEETQNGALSGYKVSFWLTSSAVPELSPKMIVREKQVVLDNLKIFSNYSVQVLAYNLAGEGPKSSIIYGRTREGVPGPPRRMEVNNVTMTTLTISWIPPEHPNGIIINYELAYYLQHSHDESQLVKLKVPGTRHYDVIDGLVMNNTYTFSIRAMTSVEPPGPAISLNITMGPQPGSPARPKELTTVIKDNSVYLSWINPEMGGLHPITGYDIQSKLENKGQWKTIFKKMSAGTSAIITFVNLVPDESYVFRPSDEESDFDSEKPLPQPPASPPPPPFSNPYINTPGVNESWRNQNSHYNNNFNAYNYTDSEADSSHYAMSLNSGQLIMNNTAGSRAPLPGFSSFV